MDFPSFEFKQDYFQRKGRYRPSQVNFFFVYARSGFSSWPYFVFRCSRMSRDNGPRLAAALCKNVSRFAFMHFAIHIRNDNSHAINHSCHKSDFPAFCAVSSD